MIYDVTDPTTGHSVTLEGSSPPTEDELEEIFRVVDQEQAAKIESAVARDTALRPRPTLERVPEPGASLSLAPRGTSLTGVPQAFPAVEEAKAETAKIPSLSLEEAEQKLTTPFLEVPKTLAELPGRALAQAPGLNVLSALRPDVTEGVQRGLGNVAKGFVEQSLLTPAAPVLGLTTLIPGVRAAAGAVFSGGAAKSAADLLGEASVTKDPQKLTEGVGMAAMAALGALATGLDIAQSRPGVFARELINENRTRQTPPPIPQQVIPPASPQLIPESRRLPAPRTRMPEFTESTLEPGGPPPRRLPAPGETEGSVLLPASELGPRTAGFRIELPVEPEAARLARERWSKPIDVEAQVEGAEAIRQLVQITDEQKTQGQPYKPPTVSTDLRQLERMIQRNTISTVESWADQVIRDRLGGASANPFLDPELLAAASVKGAILVKRGVVKFADWADQMRQQFGRGLEEKLPIIYQQSVDYWKEKGVTSAIQERAPEAIPVRQTPEAGAEMVQEIREQGAPEAAPQETIAAAPETIPPKPATAAPEAETIARPRETVEIPADAFDPAKALTPESGKVGFASPMNRNLEKIGAGLKSFGKRWFTVAGELPPEFQTLKREMQGRVSKANLGLRISSRRLMDALAEHYKLGRLEVAGGGSRKIPLQAVEAMDAYMKGSVANAAAIPAPIRGALDTMRAEIDSYSRLMIQEFERQRNRFPAGSAQWQAKQDLIDKIQNNLDVYVHRSYEFFDSNKISADEWYKDLPPNIRDSAEQLALSNAPPGTTIEQARSKILDWLSDLRDESTGGKGGRLGAKDLSILMKRKVIAPEIRAILGEHKSPLINYAKSVSKMASWLAKQEFLNEVKRQGMGTLLFEEGSNPPGFNSLIAGEGSDTMSPLNGLRTSEEIARAFKELEHVAENNPFFRTILFLNAWTKWAAVVPSPITQIRNLGGRPLMATLAGHHDVTVVPEAIRLAKADFSGKVASAADRAKLDRARELLILEGGGQSGELMAILKDASLQDLAPGELYSWSMMRALKTYGYDVPTRFYRASDNLGGLVGWLTETKNQKKVNPGWTDAQAEAEAARIVRKIYPFYSETPKAIQFFSKLPWGPFVTFAYQSKRVVVNSLHQAVSEIRSTNPEQKRLGYRRLASAIATLAFPAALQEASKIMVGIDAEAESDFRRTQPPWAQNSKWLFTDKDQQDAEIGAINLSYTDPFSTSTDVAMAAIRSLQAGDPVSDAAWESFKELAQPYIGEQMLYKAFIEARNGVTDNGRQIYNKTDSPSEKSSKMFYHVTKTLWPALAQRLERRIIPAAKGEQPVFGRKLELPQEIGAELTGFRYERHNFANALWFKAKDFREGDYAAESIFHQAIRQTKTTTEQDLLDAYKLADERRFAVWKEMRKDYLAAVRQGVPSVDAEKIMQRRQITARDADAIAKGLYQPNEVSDGMRELAKEQGRVIPMGEIRAYQAERRNLPLDD